MSRLDRDRVILAKIQPTAGTDAVPTGGANAILLAGKPSVTPFVGSAKDRDLLRSYLGASEQLVGPGYVELKFATEFQSAGAAGSAPAWGPLARGCAMAEVLLAAAVTGTAQTGSTSSTLKLAAGASATDGFYAGMRVSITGGTGSGQSALILGYTGSSKVAAIAPAWSVTPDATSTYSIDANAAYNPISSSMEMLSIYYYRAGVLRKAINCKGNLESIGAMVGERPTLNWRFFGIDAGVSAASSPSQTLTGWKVPALISDVNSGDLLIGGTAYPSRGFQMAQGNNLVYTPLLGGEDIDITNRATTGNADLDLSAAQAVTFDAAVKANGTQSFGFLHGTAAGYRMSVTGPAVQFTNQAESDINDRALEGFGMRFLPLVGNDEFRLVAM